MILEACCCATIATARAKLTATTVYADTSNPLSGGIEFGPHQLDHRLELSSKNRILLCGTHGG